MPTDATTDRRSAAGLVQSIIGHLARQTAVPPDHGVPLWSVVRDLTAFGSTASSQICVEFGFDPDLDVRAPVFVDNYRQVVRGWCAKHEEAFDEDEGCFYCDEEEDDDDE